MKLLILERKKMLLNFIKKKWQKWKPVVGLKKQDVLKDPEGEDPLDLEEQDVCVCKEDEEGLLHKSR